MSTVKDLDKIDLVAFPRDGHEALLIVLDDLPWDDEHEHLYLLQEKLNRYIEGIESGQVSELIEGRTGRPWSSAALIGIRVYFTHELTPHAEQCFQRFQDFFMSVGVSLSREYHSPASRDDSPTS